jgi:hypothetical protein
MSVVPDFYGRITVFVLQSEADLVLATQYRNAEVPFVIRNVPNLVRWRALLVLDVVSQ